MPIETNYKFEDVEKLATTNTTVHSILSIARQDGWSTERTLCTMVFALEGQSQTYFRELVKSESRKYNVIVIDGTVYVPKDD